MAVPEQIRKQTEAVQQMYEQLNTGDNTGEAEASTDGTAPQANAAADETSEDESAERVLTNEQNASTPEVSEETIAQKYRTLQGMYNAEVPRLHQQNREMTQRVQQMEQLLATLSQQSNSSASENVPTALVTEQDVEEYGESIDMMRKVSREELVPVAQRLAQIETMLRQMQDKVVPQVQAVARRQQVSAEQQFWVDLGSYVPNFRDVNADTEFQSWLLEVDPLTGITRQTYLDDAQSALDARRVANIFRTWLDTTGQAPVAQSTGRKASSELEKQVAPGRSKGAGSAAATNKPKIYTPQDIQKFFNDVRAGKYKGREQERDRIERDIFAAQRENRIQTSA